MGRKFLFASFNIIVFLLLSILLDVSLFMIHSSIWIYLLGEVLLFILSISSYFSKNVYYYNIGIFLLFLVNVLGSYQLYQLEKEYSSISNIILKKYEYYDYHLYVLKSTKYDEMNDLKDKRIGLLDDNYENSCSSLKRNYSVECISYSNITSLLEGLDNGEIQGMYLWESLKEEDVILSNYRDIYQDTVKCLK